MDTFLYGLLSGYIGAICVYPIDYIKTHVQNNRSFIDVIKTTKLKNYYKGSITQLIGIGPEKSIKLFVANYMNDELKTHHILSGACAGATQVLVTNPIEMIKIQYQMGLTQNKSIFEIIKTIRLYKGASACFLRDIPFSAIYFPTYNYLKKEFPNNYFLAGTLAGIPAAYLVTPFDVIKTRLQTEKNYTNIFDCAKKIYSENGFWRGGVWRILKSSPQFGITFYVFEKLKE